MKKKIATICSAVGIGTGVGTIACKIMKVINQDTAITLLAIGVTAISIAGIYAVED